MVIATETRSYTPEEYLELEEKAEFKSEYRDGEIIPMTGGTTRHNKIAGRLYASLIFALPDQNYDVYIGDVKVWIPRYRQYTYPDVMVIQGEPIYERKGQTIVTNLMLITEVLSKSTQNYDQGEKFKYYRSIPQMKEYLLIDQKQFYVMQYIKNEAKQWVLTEYEGESATLKLNSVEFEIPFVSLYQGVNFANIEE